MKTIATIIAILTAVAAYAAEPVASVAPAPSLVDWFRANQAVILGAALGLSELLACVPAFKGNGIIDTLIKGLKALSQKQDVA